MTEPEHKDRRVMCVSCGKTLSLTLSLAADEAAPHCVECLARSKERPGVDYDASELGGEG